MTEFYIIVIVGGLAVAYEIANKIYEKGGSNLTPLNAKYKENGEDIIIVPITNLEDAKDIQMPIGIQDEFEFNNTAEYSNTLNAEFSISIKDIEGKDIGDYTNIVTKVIWEYHIKAIVDGIEKTNYIVKYTTFDNFNPIEFIGFNLITKEIIISWIESKTNMSSLKEKLYNKILKNEVVKKLSIDEELIEEQPTNPILESEPTESEPTEIEPTDPILESEEEYL